MRKPRIQIFLAFVVASLALSSSLLAQSGSREVARLPNLHLGTDSIPSPASRHQVVLEKFFEDLAVTQGVTLSGAGSQTLFLQEMNSTDVLSIFEEVLFDDYERALLNGNLPELIAATAYLTGTANPLFNIQIATNFASPFDSGARRAYTLSYVVNNGYRKNCLIFVLKDPVTSTISDIEINGCPKFVEMY